MNIAELTLWTTIACAAYLVCTYLAYLAMAAVGLVENAIRRRESASQDYGTLSRSRFTIPVSVIVAAHNEEAGICATVRSLLALDYPEFEVIVVSDGSTDGTVEQLEREFGLQPYERFSRQTVESATVRRQLRSDAFPDLVVIDKENGGKSDALNAGLNAGRYRYVCGVDADTVFARDALLKGMRLVMSDPEKIVGVTSHIAIARDPARTMAEPVGRRAVDRRPLLAFQHLDYLRAFFSNRLAWSRHNFMLCSIGVFQLWRRDLLVECGGWATGYTCEDIELTFRVHEKLQREGTPYRIVCLPDTVGTTEGPESARKLVAQRERWQRVILETLWAYRYMCLNPRYRTAGMIGVPYYVLSEALAPFFELAAIGTLAASVALGTLSWQLFILVFLLIAFVNATLSAGAVLAADRQSRDYRLGSVVWLLLLAPLELLLYRPIMVWARLKGTWRFLRRDKAWHKFERNSRTAAA